jgi:hypothetical protein
VSDSTGPQLPAWEDFGATTCPTTSNSVSLLRRAPTLPRVPRDQTPPPCSGGLQCYHVSHDTGPRLPTWEGFGATTCPTALDLASLLRRDSTLPRVPRHQTPPPYSGGLQCCHVSHDIRPRLPAQEGFGAVVCPTTLYPASLLRRASALPHVPRLQTPSPCSGGL